LALLAAAGTMIVVAVGAVGVQSLRTVTDGQRRAQEMHTLEQAAITMDELNESLRADVVEEFVPNATPVSNPDIDADLTELRDTAADFGAMPVSGLDRSRLRRLAVDEAAFAAQAEQMLSSADPIQLHTFVQTAAALTDRVDALDADVEQLVVRLQGHQRAVQRRALLSFLAAACLSAILLAAGGWWIRRSLLASLTRVAQVASAVADGNFTARNPTRDAGEVGVLVDVIDKMAHTLQQSFTQQAREAGRHEFAGRTERALQRIDTEEELASVVSVAMSVIDDRLPMELLIADSSESHLVPVSTSDTAGPANCSAASPWSCPAVRSGQTLVQPSGRDIDACPRLRERQEGALAAVCVPLSFMGRSLGVLHAASPDGLPDDEIRQRMGLLGERTAARLGGLRAFARAEVQATTDTLTGLLNRRAFDEQVRRIAASGRDYGLLLADLDHFKRLNDIHGHGMGDRALRLFSDVLRSSLRQIDIVARYGGEEFVVALPDVDVDEALAAADRIRTALQQATVGTGIPSFSVTIGVTHSTNAGNLPDQLEIADDALMTAKRAGRNACLVGAQRTEI
jgi:diguanylate cyclase (GGDEF)-like protein